MLISVDFWKSMNGYATDSRTRDERWIVNTLVGSVTGGVTFCKPWAGRPASRSKKPLPKAAMLDL